jgi:hypothetical protein
MTLPLVTPDKDLAMVLGSQPQTVADINKKIGNMQRKTIYVQRICATLTLMPIFKRFLMENALFRFLN